MKKPTKRPRGRPSLGADTMSDHLHIRVPAAMLARIDAIRDARLDGADRAQVVRELLAKALADKR
jgi:hypothetical protein